MPGRNRGVVPAGVASTQPWVEAQTRTPWASQMLRSSEGPKSCLRTSAAAPKLRATANSLRVLDRDQHHDGVGVGRGDPARGLDPVDAGHPHVEQHQLGSRRSTAGGLLPDCSLADRLESGRRGDHIAGDAAEDAWSSTVRTRPAAGSPVRGCRVHAGRHVRPRSSPVRRGTGRSWAGCHRSTANGACRCLQAAVACAPPPSGGALLRTGRRRTRRGRSAPPSHAG